MKDADGNTLAVGDRLYSTQTPAFWVTITGIVNGVATLAGQSARSGSTVWTIDQSALLDSYWRKSRGEAGR